MLGFKWMSEWLGGRLELANIWRIWNIYEGKDYNGVREIERLTWGLGWFYITMLHNAKYFLKEKVIYSSIRNGEAGRIVWV